MKAFQFQYVLKHNSDDEMQWQDRQGGVLYILDDRSKFQPSAEQAEWYGEIGRTVHESSSGNFKIVSVRLTEPVIHTLSPRAQRRAENREAKHAEKMRLLDEKRLADQKAAEDRRRKVASRTKPKKEGNKKGRKQLSNAG